MAIRRCSLCDGKLDANNVCTFCGLDNTKSDRYYRLNQSNCDNSGYSHVHEDEKSYKKGKTIIKQSGTTNGTGKARTVREADWEINRQQARQKYSTSSSSGTQSTYKNKGERKRKPFILIIVIFVVLMQLMSVLLGMLSASDFNFIEDSVERGIENIFGDDNEYDEYDDSQNEYDGNIEEFFEEGPFFDDDDFWNQFLDEYGDDFDGEFDFEEAPEGGNI